MSHVVNNTTANNMRAAGGLRGDISNEFEGLSERLPLSTKFDTARDEGAYEKVRTRLEREGRTAEGQPSLADQVRGLQMGTLDVKDVSNANALGAAGQHILLKEKLKADRERATSDALFYALLDQLRDEIDALEAQFRNRFGDAWREEVALRVLDEIPERGEGETIEAYRERLEKELIEEMIDQNTGEIKPEYRDHKDEDIKRAAQWAQKEYAKVKLELAPDKVMAIITAENLTLEEKNNKLENYEYGVLKTSLEKLSNDKLEAVQIELVRDNLLDKAIDSDFSYS